MVLSVGRLWDRGKGADVLDDAVRILSEDDPFFPPVHVLGETTSPQGDVTAAHYLVMHGRVERAEVDAWMRRAPVYVAPSRYEPFGLAPLEAALHGCALVLSDIGTFRELWNGCAEFFSAGDAPALAEALARLNDDPAEAGAAPLHRAAHGRGIPVSLPPARRPPPALGRGAAAGATRPVRQRAVKMQTYPRPVLAPRVGEEGHRPIAVLLPVGHWSGVRILVNLRAPR
jgi:glycosyltransferase involved in cell wall biosynthesis